MKILTASTYFRPYISGMTVYAERVARGLALRGHQVRVLTSQYSKQLPTFESGPPIEIYRAKVLMRISKGVISPDIGLLATKLVRWADVVHLHLPQFDALGISLRAKFFGRPLLLTFQCDVKLPKSPINNLAAGVLRVIHDSSGMLAGGIVVLTEDYARSSRFVAKFKDKTRVISPPAEWRETTPAERNDFASRYYAHAEGPKIGIAARFASEKGFEVLLKALPLVQALFPSVQVVHVGQFEGVLGESAYFERLAPTIRELAKSGSWVTVGIVPDELLPVFYQSIDVLALPSTNSTEAFGMVQVEALAHGTPVVASNLPGVRQPVLTSGMGELCTPNDVESLAAALIKVLSNRERYRKGADSIRSSFSIENAAAEYEKFFEELLSARNSRPASR